MIGIFKKWVRDRYVKKLENQLSECRVAYSQLDRKLEQLERDYQVMKAVLKKMHLVKGGYLTTLQEVLEAHNQLLHSIQTRYHR